MDDLYNLDKPLELFVPVVKVAFTVSLKESVQLPKLQEFILSAIHKYQADISTLVDATMLPENVIRIELNDMYKQKLLSIDDDTNYNLTDLSKRLIRYVELVDQMNSQSSLFLFNLVTGEIVSESTAESFDEPSGIKANSVISLFQISSVNAPELKKQFCTVYSLPENDELIDDYLENIVIESRMVSRAWIKMYITHLPENEDAAPQKDYVFIKSYMLQREYGVYDDYLEKNHELLNALQIIRDRSEELLSEKGLELTERYNCYKLQKKKIIRIYGNPVSRAVYEGEWKPVSDVGKKYIVDIADFDSVSIGNDAFDEKLKEYNNIDFSLKQLSEKKTAFISTLPISCIVYKTEEE